MDIYEGLTEQEILVVEQLANKGGRNYDEIAAACNLSRRHLQRIRQKPHIKAAVREIVISELDDEIPDIIGTLKRNMKKGDFRSTELLAKMVGLVIERRQVDQTTTLNDNRFKNMNDDDLDDEIQEIERQLKVLQGGAK